MKSNSILHRRFIALIAPLWLFAAAQTEAYAGATFSEEAARSPDASFYARGKWEFGLESTYSFAVIPNPFFAIAGLYNKNSLDYKLATQILSLRYQLTNPSGWSFLRGNWEISGLVMATAIVEGPESYFAGLGGGLRYYLFNRVPGWRLSSKCVAQQDSRIPAGLCTLSSRISPFPTSLGAGFRYDVNRRLSITASAIDQHLSNAYITRPNYGFDSLGFSLGR